jgi:hypothetical protein
LSSEESTEAKSDGASGKSGLDFLASFSSAAYDFLELRKSATAFTEKLVRTGGTPTVKVVDGTDMVNGGRSEQVIRCFGNQVTTLT